MKEPLPDNVYKHDGIAGRYGRTGGFGAARKAPMYAVARDLLLALTPPEATLLELGAGTGHFTAQLVATGHFGHIHVTDGAPAMLSLARETLADNGRLSFDLLDFTTSWAGRFVHTPFDAVSSTMAIHHAADKEAVFQQAYDVLKPGGVFVLGDHMTAVSPLAQYLIDRERALLVLGRDTQPTTDQIKAEIETIKARGEREGNKCEGVSRYLDKLTGVGFTDASCLWRDFWLAVFIARRPPETS